MAKKTTKSAKSKKPAKSTKSKKPAKSAKSKKPAKSTKSKKPTERIETTPPTASREPAEGKKADNIARVNFEFRRKLAEKVEGNLASFCYQCGACTGDCAAALYSSEFNPREIMLKVLYGLGGELLCEDSILWECTNCYNCHERCPQEVKPVEVIISLKNMLADLGIYPSSVAKVIETFEQTGRTVPLSEAVDRQRAKYGLPPMPKVPMDEIKKLIEPATEKGDED